MAPKGISWMIKTCPTWYFTPQPSMKTCCWTAEEGRSDMNFGECSRKGARYVLH